MPRVDQRVSYTVHFQILSRSKEGESRYWCSAFGPTTLHAGASPPEKLGSGAAARSSTPHVERLAQTQTRTAKGRIRLGSCCSPDTQHSTALGNRNWCRYAPAGGDIHQCDQPLFVNRAMHRDRGLLLLPAERKTRLLQSGQAQLGPRPGKERLGGRYYKYDMASRGKGLSQALRRPRIPSECQETQETQPAPRDWWDPSE